MKNKQMQNRIAFLLICSVLLGVIWFTQQDDSAENGSNPSVLSAPEEVRAAAVQAGEQELERRQTLDEENGFQNVRLERIASVYQNQDFEGVSVQVYQTDFSFLRDSNGSPAWRPAARSCLLAFRNTNDGRTFLGNIPGSVEVGGNDFSEALHAVLLQNGLAAYSLDNIIGQEVTAHLSERLPADCISCAWTLLDSETDARETTAYVLTLYHGISSSPAITDRGETLITCKALLPAVLIFRQGTDGTYTLLSYWEPTQQNYEADLLRHFPSDTAHELIDGWTAVLKKLMSANQKLSGVFNDSGPVWPSYQFSMDTATLCGLADYYPAGDIYANPVREEIARRFYQAPVDFLNALAACSADVQNSAFSQVSALQDQPSFPEAMEMLERGKIQLSEGGSRLWAGLKSGRF